MKSHNSSDSDQLIAGCQDLHMHRNKLLQDRLRLLYERQKLLEQQVILLEQVQTLIARLRYYQQWLIEWQRHLKHE